MLGPLLILAGLGFGPCDELPPRDSFSTAVTSATICVLAANDYISGQDVPVYVDVGSFEGRLIQLGLLAEVSKVLKGGARADSERPCKPADCTSEADGVRITLLEAEPTAVHVAVLVSVEVARRPGRYRRTPTVCTATVAMTLLPSNDGWRVEAPRMRQIC